MTYWSVYVHVHVRDFNRIYAKFREIWILYFRASLCSADAKNAEEKSQVRIVFKRSVGRERRGKNALEAPVNSYVRRIRL